MATAFSTMRERAGFLYGADLTGAGAGSAAVLLMLGRMEVGMAVSVSSLGAVAASFLLGRRRAAAAAAVAVVITSLIPTATGMRMSPYKELSAALGFPGAELIETYQDGFTRVDAFRSPMARFAPGLGLKYAEPLPEQVGLAVDGSDINAITRADRGGLEFLRYLPSALPYETGARKTVLAVDPGGGLPVLMAREYGAEAVYSVEASPLLLRAVKEGFGAFSGGIYSANARSGLARGLLRGSEMKFDLIDLSLMGATPSSASGMSEDYRYTVEAFREYLGHLAEGGVLSVSLYIVPPPRAEFRLLSTAVAALEEIGVPDASRNIAAIRSWGSITMLVKPTPLTPAEEASVREFARRMNFDLVYLPDIREGETNVYVRMRTDEYYGAFKRLISPAEREAFKHGYLFDIGEVRDERPFFHFHLKPSRLAETYRVMGRKWQYFIEEGYLLPVVFVQALIMGAIILFLPALRKPPSPAYFTRLSYFAFLGVGFMFIEIPLIQRMILPLENTSYAAAVVIAAVLVSSGAGSLLSQRFPRMRSPYVVLAVALAALPYAFLFSYALNALAGYPLVARAALSAVLIFPIGLLMGIPFPLGMRNVGGGLVPWAYAVNGCFSVIAPMLAAMAAMALGFGAVLLLGAAMYALAFFSGRTFMDRRVQ
jgi:hypothetical protein